MSEPAVANLSLARLVKIEQRVLQAEDNGLHARWEFGSEVLKERDSKGRLPNGRLTEICGEVCVSRQEVGARIRFAEQFPTEAEVANAVSTFGSWHAIVNKALAKRAEQPVAVATPVELLDGVYRTIAADPPWRYGNTSTRGAAEDHYPTMSVAELCELPVDEWAADESHLYLWTTNGFLREAFEVMDAWGFTYKTTLTWAKTSIGLGNYFRSSTEHILFGVKGGLMTLDSNQRNWFETKRGRHSAKPGRFFEIVEKASPGPYLEMFARAEQPLTRQHWKLWGNEV